MNEPTKEAMDEAIRLRLKFCAPDGTMSSFEVVGLIAHIRTEAHNAAIEMAADAADVCGDYRNKVRTSDYVDAIEGLRIKV